MTAPAVPMEVGAPAQRFRDTLASEWVKVSTLHAVYPLLALATGIAVGIGALLSATTGDSYAALGPAGRSVFDPVATALSAMPYANVIVAAMAVTLVASEYQSGMMRLTLTMTPGRWRVLCAKLLTVAGPALLSGMLSAALAVAVGLRLLSARGVPTPGLGDAGVVAAVAGAGAGTCLIAVLSVCLAVTVRRIAVANGLTNLIALLPGILYPLPDWWQRNLVAYLPTGASGSLAGTVAGRTPAHLPALAAYAVMLGWAAALVLATGVALTRRDA